MACRPILLQRIMFRCHDGSRRGGHRAVIAWVGVATLAATGYLGTGLAAASSSTPGTRPASPAAGPAAHVNQLATTAPSSTSALGPSGLQVIDQETGHVSESTDGVGILGNDGTFDEVKPAGATLRKAILLVASTGGGGPASGSVAVNGTTVSLDHATTSGIGSVNYWDDVTSILQPTVDAADTGALPISWYEENSYSIDGAILMLIYNDPAQTTNQAVSVLFGALQPTGDEFNVSLSKPWNPDSAGAILQLSMGISFSYQSNGSQQYSTIDVNGSRLSSSAGGEDDGEAGNGALLTVGGTGDSPDNPDPNAAPTNPRSDDELYDLAPFVATGSSTININTDNPSNDDNVFFASLVTNPPASSIVTSGGSTRYVALGDSVPYGHGLANPYTTTQIGTGKATSQAPSTSAYPSLVASQFGLTLKSRTSNCPLSGDQLAVSGAPLTADDLDAPTAATGPTQCTTRRTVQSDEQNAAALSTTPADLVTIQAGADDIHFADCLEWEATQKGTPSIAGHRIAFGLGTQCLSPTGQPLPKTASELANVRTHLAQLIEQVSPNAQQVAVVNYYNPVPSPTDFKDSTASPSAGQVDPLCLALQLNKTSAYNDAVTLQGDLNDEIALAVEDAQIAGVRNVRLVDISNLEQHHEMCTANPGLFAGELMPVTQLERDASEIAVLKLIYSPLAKFAQNDIQAHVWRAAHPNVFGQQDIANAIVAAFSRY